MNDVTTWFFIADIIVIYIAVVFLFLFKLLGENKTDD